MWRASTMFVIGLMVGVYLYFFALLLFSDILDPTIECMRGGMDSPVPMIHIPPSGLGPVPPHLTPVWVCGENIKIEMIGPSGLVINPEKNQEGVMN